MSLFNRFRYNVPAESGFQAANSRIANQWRQTPKMFAFEMVYLDLNRPELAQSLGQVST